MICVYLGYLSGSKKFDMIIIINGFECFMVLIGNYECVMFLDIIFMFLFRDLIFGDIDGV